MSDHYYSPHPSSKSEERQFQAELLDHLFTFQTDAGVFSKKGVDFGSRFLIETVEIGHATKVLDLGCGYGPIGIAIAHAHPHTQVMMVDINERAVELATENAKRNQVFNQVKVVVSNGFAAISEKGFDHILLNPPIRVGKEIIYGFFADAKAYLKQGGSLWIVIRKQQGAQSARKELEQIYSSVEVVAQKKGYWIIQAINED